MRRNFLICLVILSCCWSSVYFSPNGGAREALARLLNSTDQSVDVAMYSFTSKELGLALASAAQKGRHVRVIADASQSASKSSVVSWLSHYVEIRLLHQEGVRGIMHHKFMVIDKAWLTTGSYNWTTNAETFNNENLLILSDPELITQYKNEFERLWKQARPVERVVGQ